MTTTTSTTTSSVACPGTACTCRGAELVTVRKGRGRDRTTGKRRPTLVYSPCAPLVAQGWSGPMLVLWADLAPEVQGG